MSERPFISSALGGRPTVPYPNTATGLKERRKRQGRNLKWVPGVMKIVKCACMLTCMSLFIWVCCVKYVILSTNQKMTKYFSLFSGEFSNIVTTTHHSR